MADKFGSDTIVIIRNDNLPLLEWLKQILELHTERNKIVKITTIKMADEIIKRSITNDYCWIRIVVTALFQDT